MSESDNVYSSKLKYSGIFNFKEFYQFCYQYLSEEKGLTDIYEKEYSEKISGSEKELKVEWEAEKYVTDYFEFLIKVTFEVKRMTQVEITRGGVKESTNKGDLKISVKGDLVKDYDSKFETSAKMKIWRSIYEKWIIAQRVEAYEDKISSICDDFLGEAKAFLDLEGRD